MTHARQVIDVFLQPGEYYVGDAHCRIRTLLGSCVSIVLWHPRLRIGAMSHFLLSSRGCGAVGELDARYAEEATTLMLRELAREKVVPQECQAKLFGGSNMFPRQTSPRGFDIGHKNGEAARALMRLHAIPIVSESLFGVGHRQIIFEVGTGDVWSRQVKAVDTLPPETKPRP
jgi:chemotaxis protein CheD